MKPHGQASSTGFAVALAQASLLVALISVPLFANPLSSRGFQEDRIILLRLLGTLGWAVLIVRPTRVRGLGLIGLGAALYLLASTLSAIFSQEPIAAQPGAYLRQAGWQTDLGLVGIFLAATTFASRPRLTELALRALLLGGAASSILALAQTAGLQVPLTLPGTRSGGFTGGPTYLGSCLAVLLPMAVARLRSLRDWEGRASLALAVLLLLGLLATASRASLLAGLCGTVLVGIWLGQPKLMLKWGALLLLIAALFSLPFVRDRLPTDALPNRLFSDSLGDQIGTRALLYRDALSSIAHQGGRLLIGRGPDTIGNRFSAEVTQDLQKGLGGRIRIDRLHSDPLDLIYTRGVPAALGVLLLIAFGLRVGHRAARSALASAPTIGLAASLLAIFIDGALSVPGAGSRLLLFFAAGWLAGRGAGPRETQTEPPGPAPVTVGLGTAAGLAVVLFGVGDLRHAWVALPLLALLKKPVGRVRALFAAAALLIPFLALHLALDSSGARLYSASGPGAYADRARLDVLLLLLTLLLAVIGMASVQARTERAPARGGGRWIARTAAALALLFFVILAWNDARRLLADVNARAALDAQMRGGSPVDASELLEAALLLAPEVAEYRKLAMLAYTDEAHGRRGRDTAELRDRTGVHVARILADHPTDAFALAQSARCAIEFARLLPEQAQGLTTMALEFAERALRAAPFATPVLHVTAEVLIVSGDLDRAAELLDRSLSVDLRETRGLLLRGRVLAAQNDLEGASHFYGLANDSGVGKNECLAALTIAAGATDRIEDAATLAMLLADRAPQSPRLELDVQGARPLLRQLGNDRFKEFFDHAERIYRGAPENLARVRAALDY